MPLFACAVASALQESCPATRSPSCERVHRQTGKPLPPPACVVSSSTYLFGWTVTASHGAFTTKMRSQRGQKDQTNEHSGLCHLGRYGSHFYCVQCCPKAGKKCKTQKLISLSCGRTIERAIKSDRSGPVPASVWQVCTHTMMWNRDHLCELPYVIVRAIICKNEKAPRASSDANSI